MLGVQVGREDRKAKKLTTMADIDGKSKRTDCYCIEKNLKTLITFSGSIQPLISQSLAPVMASN